MLVQDAFINNNGGNVGAIASSNVDPIVAGLAGNSNTSRDISYNMHNSTMAPNITAEHASVVPQNMEMTL